MGHSHLPAATMGSAAAIASTRMTCKLVMVANNKNGRSSYELRAPGVYWIIASAVTR